jgi:hypothetical protein
MSGDIEDGYFTHVLERRWVAASVRVPCLVEQGMDSGSAAYVLCGDICGRNDGPARA